MHKSAISLIAISTILVSASVLAQTQPQSDPQAITLASESVAAMTGGTSISDVTLSGTVSWHGSDTGTATLKALGADESRMDLVLTGGTRAEIRDAQSGAPVGKWVNPDNSSGQFASHNCWTDSVWFFPALGSLTAGPGVVLSYIGQETRNGSAVQHIQSYLYDPSWPSGVTPTGQQLSTTDFYLDASTFVPVAVTFNAHPDNDATINLAIEIDFSDYQSINGALVAQRIQRYSQGTLVMDASLTNVTFNTGLSLSDFAVD